MRFDPEDRTLNFEIGLRCSMFEVRRSLGIWRSGPRWVECLDGFVRVAKGIYTTPHVRKCIIQNAYSTDADLVKSALTHTAKLTNKLAKRQEKKCDERTVAVFEECTTIGLRISGYGTAEVFIDFAEEKHTEIQDKHRLVP